MAESPEVFGEPGGGQNVCVFFLVLFSHFPKRMLYTFSLGLGIMGCIYFLTSRCIMGKDSRAL